MKQTYMLVVLFTLAFLVSLTHGHTVTPTQGQNATIIYHSVGLDPKNGSRMLVTLTVKDLRTVTPSTTHEYRMSYWYKDLNGNKISARTLSTISIGHGGDIPIGTEKTGTATIVIPTQTLDGKIYIRLMEILNKGFINMNEEEHSDTIPTPTNCIGTAPQKPALINPTPVGLQLSPSDVLLKWSGVTGWGINCAGNKNQYIVYLGYNDPLPKPTEVGRFNSGVTQAQTGYLQTQPYSYFWQVTADNGAFVTDSDIYYFRIGTTSTTTTTTTIPLTVNYVSPIYCNCATCVKTGNTCSAETSQGRQNLITFKSGNVEGNQLIVPRNSEVQVKVFLQSNMEVPGSRVKIEIRKDKAFATDEMEKLMVFDFWLQKDKVNQLPGSFSPSYSFVANDETVRSYFIKVYYCKTDVSPCEVIYDPTDPDNREWVKLAVAPTTTTQPSVDAISIPQPPRFSYGCDERGENCIVNGNHINVPLGTSVNVKSFIKGYKYGGSVIFTDIYKSPEILVTSNRKDISLHDPIGTPSGYNEVKTSFMAADATTYFIKLRYCPTDQCTFIYNIYDSRNTATVIASTPTTTTSTTTIKLTTTTNIYPTTTTVVYPTSTTLKPTTTTLYTTTTTIPEPSPIVCSWDIFCHINNFINWFLGLLGINMR